MNREYIGRTEPITDIVHAINSDIGLICVILIFKPLGHWCRLLR